MRILFVARADSTHTARWVGQLAGRGWDLHLFPVVQTEPPHAALREVTIHDLFRARGWRYDPSVRQAARLVWPLPKGRSKAQRALDRLSGGRLGYPARLARLVRRLRPDVVHALEMQKAGYMTADARDLYGPGFPPWIYSCWGSDLYWYGRFPDHATRIRHALGDCDYLITDCRRDVALAVEFGFRGESLGVVPGVGGFDVEAARKYRRPGPPSARRVVAVKGYHDDDGFGRGLVALRALRACVDALRGYEVVVFSAVPATARAARELARDTGLEVSVLPFGPFEEVMRLLGRSRMVVALSVSDGTPNTLLEAMVTVALPIQSDTVSTAEWVTDGVNGRLVPPEDEAAVAAAVRAALSDDALVDRAAELNLATARERIDRSIVLPRVLAMYGRAGSAGR